MLRDYMAARELERVAPLSAFNVEGYTTRRKVNQHATLYRFPDGSSLFLRTTVKLGDAWHKDWNGRADDIHLGPVQDRPINVNRAS